MVSKSISLNCARSSRRPQVRSEPHPTEAALRETHHEYYATITAMDFHIGRLLQTQASQLDQRPTRNVPRSNH
jgi:arylsulfatase A-like enzyme